MSIFLLTMFIHSPVISKSNYAVVLSKQFYYLWFNLYDYLILCLRFVVEYGLDIYVLLCSLL